MNLINKLKKMSITDIFHKVKTSAKDKRYQDEIHILLQAMINASKADGVIDAREQEKIIEFMGHLSEEEKLFVEDEMRTPLDSKSFLKAIPKGMEKQVYYMSVFTINLDVEAERDYLEMLEKELKLTKDEVNSIQEDLGVTELV